MPEKPPSSWRWLLLIPLAAALLVAVIGGVYISNGLAATRWSTTEGTIVESGFPLKYEFTVDGKRHEGSELSHSFVNPPANEMSARYPVGQNVTVHYATSEGTYLSVLEPGFHFDTILVTVLSMVFAFLFWKGLRPPADRREPNDEESSTQSDQKA